MNEAEQIKEMAKDICRVTLNCNDVCNPVQSCMALKYAERAYKAGYRKQREGEWIDTGDFELDNIYSGWKCSHCGYIFCGSKTNYCPECGAKMKGGDDK